MQIGSEDLLRHLRGAADETVVAGLDRDRLDKCLAGMSKDLAKAPSQGRGRH